MRICVPAEGDGKAGKDGNGSLVFTGLAFHGVPSGHEFNSFVLGLYNAAGPGQPLGDDLIERAKSITDPLNIMILVSLTCTMCPETVLASQRIASLSPAVRAEAYDVSHFPELKDQYGAMSVPCIVITHATAPSKLNSAKRASPKCSNWSARKPHDLRYSTATTTILQNRDVHRLMRSMRPTPAESLFCGSSASVFDGLRDVSVAEVLDQADADQGHNEQAGEHRDECGVAVGLIRRMGNYERGQLVAGQTGERPGAQRQTVRGGDGFGAEVLIKQHGQRRETATIARVDEEQHGQHGPQQSVADAVGEDLQQAHGNRHDEDYLIDGLAALQVVGECGEAHAASVLNTESTASTSPMMPEMAAANLAGLRLAYCGKALSTSCRMSFSWLMRPGRR